MSKAYFEDELLKRRDELDSMDDVLCVGLMSLSSYSSSARSAMLTQHLTQAVVPDEPDVPGVSTGYEHLFGRYSSTFKKTDARLKVFKKIVKFDGFAYTLVTFNSKTNEYDVIQRNEVKNMAESYGFRYNNTEIDKYETGSIIKKDSMLYCSPTLDEYENFRYGVNAKVCYVISQETIEDAVVVSERFANRLSTTKVESCRIPLNDNDIPLNLYGDSNTYKAFPDIGEWIEDSILCGTRRKNKTTDQLGLKNSNLRKIFPNDDIFQTLGSFQIVDINIWSNKPVEDIPDLPAHSQVKSYYFKILDYWQNIYDTLGGLIEDAESKGYTYSTELSRLYAKARDFLDPNCRYTDSDRMFSNMILEFTFAKSEPLRIGSKLCGRFGNKSVISKILSDDEMGSTDDGIIPDIRIDALGVLSRLNSGQLFEHELNWVADAVKYKMSKLKNTEDRFSLLTRFIKMANPKQHDELVEYWDTMIDEDRDIFIDDVLNDRIYIMQSPSESITGDQMRDLYDTFKPKKSRFKLLDEDGEYIVPKDIIVADEYIMRLKQDPSTKFSVRSKALINPRTFLPIRSVKNKKHKTIYSDQADRVGEQELSILMLSNDTDALDYFYRSYASSVEGRRSDTLFTQDSSDGFNIDMEFERSMVIDILNAYFKSMGLRLDIEYDNVSQEEIEMDDDTNIPDYLKKMFD